MTPGTAVVVGGLVALLLGVLAFEHGGLDSRRLGLVATLSAIAIASRVLIPIPSAKPVTAICLIAGVSLGPRAGAAVGATSALVSNIFLGQGPWTPWQMLSWALVGASGGFLRHALRRRLPLVLAGAFWAFAFGAIMNVWMLSSFGPELSPAAFALVEVRGLPFDLAHAVATVVILGTIGPAAIRLLDRYAIRLEGRYGPQPPGRTVPSVIPLVLLVAVLAVALAPPSASAATPGDRGADFLRSRLGANGCYSEPGGQPSSSLTGWVVIGLAAQRSPVPARALGCLERSVGTLDSATDLERTILAVVAAGANPRQIGGSNLVARLLRERRGGRIGPLVNSTIFGVLALAAANEPIPSAVRRRLVADQLRDGSYGLGIRGDSNLTAAAIQALRAARYPRSATVVRRSVTALRRFQNRDGGYGLGLSDPSDGQSTAWATQGLAAAGKPADRAISFLRSLQRPDGSFAYTRGRLVTPAWVTAQVLPGLARRPFPIE